MAHIGRRVTLGLARESARGDGAAPTFWIPHQNLTFDAKANKAITMDAVGVIEDATDQFVTETWGEGEISGEVNDDSFGLFLYALLGSLSTSGPSDSAYTHTFSISQTNNHQSLALTYIDPIHSSAAYQFPLVMLNSLELSITPGGVLTYSAGFVSKREADATGTAAFTVQNRFVSKHLVAKFAADLSGLAAASAVSLKALTLRFEKNVTRDTVLGTIAPEDIFNQQFSCEGEITLNYTDRTYRNYLLAETYRAFRADFINTDVLIGAATRPELQINLPRVQFFDWAPDQALDSIVTQTIKFKALRDVSGGNAAVSSIVLVNDTASY